MKLITLCSIQCLYAKGEEQTKLNVLLLVVVDKKVCTRINKILWEKENCYVSFCVRKHQKNWS